MTKAENLARWTKTAGEVLVGRKITDAFYTTAADNDGITQLLITLDDGTVLVPLCDDEGNDPGAVEWIRQDPSGVQQGLLPVL